MLFFAFLSIFLNNIENVAPCRFINIRRLKDIKLSLTVLLYQKIVDFSK